MLRTRKTGRANIKPGDVVTLAVILGAMILLPGCTQGPQAIDFGADFELIYCGLGGSVSTSAGLGIAEQQHFSQVNVRPGDYLVVPGARVKHLTSPAFKANKELFQWLRDAHANGTHLVSICAGALVLAHARLLDGIPCTTHFQLTEKLRQLAPRAVV